MLIKCFCKNINLLLKEDKDVIVIGRPFQKVVLFGTKEYIKEFVCMCIGNI